MRGGKPKVYRLRSKLWLYPGESANWHFLTVPKKESTRIKEDHVNAVRGWGSLRVEAKVGRTSWKTSIFPDSKSGTYLLPVKADVRRKEGLYADDEVSFSIKILK